VTWLESKKVRRPRKSTIDEIVNCCLSFVLPLRTVLVSYRNEKTTKQKATLVFLIPAVYFRAARRELALPASRSAMDCTLRLILPLFFRSSFLGDVALRRC